ncbi:Cys-Gln thioester bond-forming surface protein [Pseudoramibacter sp.]|jgi:hypothetical protein|uniref:Cys-Gln thioester bond-forming surface protein n=1 Tax=Pseudoramibacter sp. TaxID=2034862 RepID=UPI0025EBAB7A|nr:Cys-Gln thioester bond-forming surface protein [Pseudoramibacter sp.]MCH4072348.1 Cys-Gln thioester bond-forming surface protein [Pseudoramibacter sp.]MCH4106119.1 Cys-Gln thioester bond-forming surface protein [Pseudoramibacter sp.]
MKKFLTALLTAALALTVGLPVFAQSSSSTFAIQYDSNDMHYVPAATAKLANADDKFILYCMNADLHWPHQEATIATEVPDYTEDASYLKASDFKSTDDYNAFMRKLKIILYAGYPYNGLGLYTIEKDGQISEAEFNKLLVVPDSIRSDFKDILGDTTFSYSDWTSKNTANLNKLVTFVNTVSRAYVSDPSAKTASGMTYQEVYASNFFQAAEAVKNAESNSQTPLEEYSSTHGLLTEANAYKATQYAVWELMNEYGVANNTTFKPYGNYYHPFADTLYDTANGSDMQILDGKPDSSKISISGNTTMTYDATQKKWISGDLTVNEPSNYNGTYTISVPDGVSVETTSGGNTVKGGESFTLVSDKPTNGSVTVSAKLVWMEALKVYSPVSAGKTNDNKGFQHMVGTVMHTATVSASANFTSTPKSDETKPATPSDSNKTTGDTTKTAGKTGSTSQPAATAPADGKSLTAALTGDNTNVTQYADWFILGGLGLVAMILIRKKAIQ